MCRAGKAGFYIISKYAPAPLPPPKKTNLIFPGSLTRAWAGSSSAAWHPLGAKIHSPACAAHFCDRIIDVDQTLKEDRALFGGA